MTSEWNPLTNDLTQLAKEGHTTLSKRQRQRETRGLPDRSTLLELAATYLEVQAQLWPEMVKLKLLPKQAPETLESMAVAFERRFRTGELDTFLAVTSGIWSTLAAGYTRFSDDNSNPRSLAQQLRNILMRARQDNAFIPWEYVFADAAVTGTIASRRSYQMTKDLLREQQSPIDSLYIDEIGRASRDAIEAMNLGRLIDRSGKRMIGVTDGFDSNNAQSKLMLAIFATLQEWFIDQLRSKVNRGMDDAFRQGANISPPCVGYRLVPVQDQYGAPVFDNTGAPVHTKVIDEVEAAYVRKAFDLFVNQGWNRARIAAMFNEEKVGGMTSWVTSTIRQLLQRETYAGRECYRMTRYEFDPQTGEKTTIRRPRSEWLVREMPHLRIVSDELWEAAQERLKQVARAYAGRHKDAPRRSDVYPRSLLQVTCSCCGEPLRLGRGGKYASYCCPNGIDRKHGCTFKGYKSVAIVESAILDHLRGVLFTDEFIDRLVEEANQFLATLAKQPRKNLAPLKNEIRQKKFALQRITEKLGESESEDLDAIFAKVADLERQIKVLESKLDEAEAGNQGPPPPLTKLDVTNLLADLRGLLEQDPAMAAPALAALVGPIVVEQTDRPSKRGKAWLAKFTVNSVPVLASLAAHKDCPATSTLELLRRRNWTISMSAETLLENVPQYVRIAKAVESMADKGAAVSTIAAGMGITWQSANNALEFARAGTRPKPEPPRRAPRRNSGPATEPKYKQIAPSVVELRDEKLIPFRQIAKECGVHVSTVVRAYDFHHREATQAAAKLGTRPKRGRHVRVGADKHQLIRTLIASGMSPERISATVGCGISTVYRQRVKQGIG